MVTLKKVIKYLDSKKIKYEIVNHKTVYTAYDKAATLKVKSNVIGKTLVLKADGGLIMVLAPGNKNLDLVKITRLLRQRADSARRGKIGFVSEKILKNKFKGVKLGAIPPFGEIYKLELFMDRGLLREKKIFINTGIYESSFKVSPGVLEKMGAVLGTFSKAKSHK